MKLITYQQVAEMLGMKLGTAYALVSQNRIPHVRLSGRMVRFDQDAIVAWVEKQKVSASDEQAEAHAA
jgi:excisionase family DNA binding protein